MANFLNIQSEFLDKAILLIEQHMGREDFGVSDLAEKIGMSRSNLLRKTQKLTGLSVSILIRKVRLNRAKELLADDRLNVSEVSYEVGFNSVSYFIKCFREDYGYPPGEESRRQEELAATSIAPDTETKRPAFFKYLLLAAMVLVLVLAGLWMLRESSETSDDLDKSIAVLPFQNDSADSTNVYIINGLMEAILNNLQKIEDLRVVSRTSVEKYRNGKMTMAQIAKELDVSYVIEGSGQKMDDQLLLTIQLIEAPKDRHLWSERYSRELGNIFQLQAEVAQDIAEEIRAFITPEEKLRIEKQPTENLQAYDFFLKGLNLRSSNNFGDLPEAIGYFKQAIEEDEEFAHAYASLAICYYYLDIFQIMKPNKEAMNKAADQALLLDAELYLSLIAKGLFYMEDEQYPLAVQFFEKALLFNPNSAEANNFLSVIYANYLPDTQKYLTYALEGISLDKTGIDSFTVSNSYLHLGNALVQNGFIDEAEESLRISLDYNPDNLFSQYVYAYVLLARDRNLQRTSGMLLKVLEQDTTRLDVMQEVAKIYYAMEEYELAAEYYDVFLTAKEALGYAVFDGEYIKISHVYKQLGRLEDAEKCLEKYRLYAENDQSMYKGLTQAAYYTEAGEVEKGIASLKEFALQKNYQYWFVLFLEGDPVMEQLSSHPDYESTVNRIKEKFWEDHANMRRKLNAEQLL